MIHMAEGDENNLEADNDFEFGRMSMCEVDNTLERTSVIFRQ